MIPPPVNASEIAIRAMVRFPVRTRGSRSIDTPLETASIPVYVPPPSEYARRRISMSGRNPIVLTECE